MYAFCFSNLESSMRNHVLAAGLLSLISTFAMADKDAVIRSTPAQRAAIQTQFMKERLELPADVLAKVQAINLKYAQQLDPVLKGTDGRFSKMQQSRGIMAAKDAELQSVLSPSQFEAYDKARDEIKEALVSRVGQ